VGEDLAGSQQTGEHGRGLLDWVSRPSETRGIRFAADGDDWAFTSYAELASGAAEVSRLLADHGVAEGSVAAIVIPSGPDFVAAYFGCLLAGVTPCPLVPPTLFENPDDWAEHTSGLIGAASSAVLTTDAIGDAAAKAGARAGLARPPIRVVTGQSGSCEPVRRAMPPYALLQFTSGSSGQPRGVRVTSENLETMIDAIFAWVPWGPDDAGAHWLPLYHDFGLIGCLLAPATRQRDLWILRPEQFVAAPRRWLECFGAFGASFSAAPGFAFAYAMRKVDPATLAGHDYSHWRGAVLGAERLDATVLDRFARMLEPHGFRRETYMPAYGLAEATLGVTGVPAGQLPRAVGPNWGALEFGRPVEIRREALLGSPQIDERSGWLLSCGIPHAGTSVSIVDDDGAALPPGHLGEISVTGPMVTDGYWNDAAGSSTRYVGSELRTGDAGFVRDGELYVVGRLGDALKVRGRSFFAEDLEAKLTTIDGIRRGRCAVVPATVAGSTTLTAIVEGGDGTRDWADRAVKFLQSEVGPEPRIEVRLGPPGTIPRTSSGKPRRRVLAERLMSGDVDGAVLVAGSREAEGWPSTAPFPQVSAETSGAG
jgi:fatty-acyl-CoA synthase